MSAKRDLKSPDQQPAESTRAKQLETPALVYVDLSSCSVCADNYEPLPPDNVEDPGVRIGSKKLANVSTKPTGIGIQK